jgi:hypothetical protein
LKGRRSGKGGKGGEGEKAEGAEKAERAERTGEADREVGNTSSRAYEVSGL